MMPEQAATKTEPSETPRVIARRMIAFFVGIIAAPIAGWCWGFHLISWYWWSASTIAVIAAAVVIACIAVLLMRPRLAWPPIVLLVWCAFLVYAMPTWTQRLACGAHAIIAASHLRSLAQHGANEIAATGQLPPSFAVFLAEKNELSRWDRRPCLCDSLADVRIGRYSLQDFADGLVTLEALRAEVQTNPPGEFERLGRITIWRNLDAWKHGLIVAWRRPDDPRWDWLNAAWSNPYVRNLDYESDEFLGEESARALAHGVSYPKELTDLFSNRQRR